MDRVRFVFRLARLDRKWGIENSRTEHGEMKGVGGRDTTQDSSTELSP